MRHYETIYIINPNLGDEDCHEIIAKVNHLVENQKGVLVKSREWGKQRLAYAVKNFYYGFYVLVDFCAEPGVTAELERILKLDDNIIKYQTVKLADNADPQELILKEKGTDEESAATEDQENKEKPLVPDEEAVEKSEVEDGEK
ncbi:30S ribosomal protein S6 [Thermodesulfobacteriota bacterium]